MKEKQVLCSDIQTSMSTLERSTLSKLTKNADFSLSVVPNLILRGALTGNYENKLHETLRN